LAATAKRLPAEDCLAVARKLVTHDEDASDTHIPLLVWWAIEDKATSERDQVLNMLSDRAIWQRPLVRDTIVERLARRYLAEKTDDGYASCAKLLALAPTPDDRLRVVAGMEQESAAFGARLAAVPEALAEPIAELRRMSGSDLVLTRLALRLGSREALQDALARAMRADEPQPSRLAMISALSQTGDSSARASLLALLEESRTESEPIRLAALGALERFSDDDVASQVLGHYASFSPALRARAVTLLASRKSWSLALVAAVAAEQVDAKDVTVDQLRQMLAHDDPQLAADIEARWGKTRPATPGEKMAYVPVMGRVLAAGKGDLPRGQELFKKHCATCHTLFGEGNKVGPDLTSADRKNRDALLLNILDPSGYVRPEFVAQVAVLNDGRVLTGLVVESSPQEISIVDAKNQRTTVARNEIEQIQPSTQTLMPERLLEVLEEQEVRDLFSYLQSDGTGKTGGGK
jgi:putative heme-binding domain-containing protein